MAAESVGDTPTFTLDPTTPYLTFDNNTTTTETDADTDRYYSREETSNHITITGGIQLGRERNDSAAVHNPTLYTVTVLADVLSQQFIHDPEDRYELLNMESVAARIAWLCPMLCP